MSKGSHISKIPSNGVWFIILMILIKLTKLVKKKKFFFIPVSLDKNISLQKKKKRNLNVKNDVEKKKINNNNEILR